MRGTVYHRAMRLASLLNTNHTKIRLMDGHGRFLFLFLVAVLEVHGLHRLNSLTIELVDIDADVNDWHVKAFCGARCVQCVCEDILFLRTGIHILLYLNFCGIGKKNAFESLKEFLLNGNACMFSASTARAAKRRLLALIGRLQTKERVETGRKNFLTYIVNCTA